MEKQLVANGKVKYEMEFQPVSSKNKRRGRKKNVSSESSISASQSTDSSKGIKQINKQKADLR